MVHCVLIKMIKKNFHYFINKKNHPIIVDMLKSKIPKFWDVFFMLIQMGVFF
jgi:hypothetical protein